MIRNAVIVILIMAVIVSAVAQSWPVTALLLVALICQVALRDMDKKRPGR